MVLNPWCYSKTDAQFDMCITLAIFSGMTTELSDLTGRSKAWESRARNVTLLAAWPSFPAKLTLRLWFAPTSTAQVWVADDSKTVKSLCVLRNFPFLLR